MNPTIDAAIAEAVALADHSRISDAEALVEACAAFRRAAQDALREAEAAAAQARDVLPQLVEQGAAGDLATPAAVASATAGARDAEAWTAYLATVVRRREEGHARAKAALAGVCAAAWLPVLQRGQDLRIAAAVKCDAAQRITDSLGLTAFPQEMRDAEAAKVAAENAARPLFDAGTAIIDLAVKNGARLPADAGWLPATWPATERAERQHWRRPLGADVNREAVDAAT